MRLYLKNQKLFFIRLFGAGTSENNSLLRVILSLIRGGVSLIRGDVSLIRDDVSLIRGDISLIQGNFSLIRGCRLFGAMRLFPPLIQHIRSYSRHAICVYIYICVYIHTLITRS